MGLKKLPYKDLNSLIKNHITNEESIETIQLVKELSSAKKRGYLTRQELKNICKWKSPRTIRLIEKNSYGIVKSKTQKAFKTKSERTKIEYLTSLQGVSIPMASAILMLVNPQRYGVIDIRVWQVLYQMKSVTHTASGIGFRFNNWYQYLMIIRYYAKKYNVKARDIERTLFNVHKIYQLDKLYKY